MKRGVEIKKKYLVPGHAQMDCDSMYSTIERKLVVDVMPRDYIVIFESARVQLGPYNVTEVHQDQVILYKHKISYM